MSYNWLILTININQTLIIMYLQITNTKLSRYNQIGTTKSGLFADLKKMGWSIKDCSVKEITKPLLSDKQAKI